MRFEYIFSTSFSVSPSIGERMFSSINRPNSRTAIFLSGNVPANSLAPNVPRSLIIAISTQSV